MKKTLSLAAIFGFVCVGLLAGCQKKETTTPPEAPAANTPAAPAAPAPDTNAPAAPAVPATNAPAQ
jgi:hypothetical protein